MGVFPYELKNTFEPRLSTRLTPPVAVPAETLFVPQAVIARRRGADHLEILLGDPVLPALSGIPAGPATPIPLRIFNP
jgi:hypothetical protein